MTAIITTREDLRELLAEELPAAIHRANNQPNPEKLFTISQTARKLGKSYNTICNMIGAGRIQTTADYKYISQQAITNYLTGKK